jgi:hypothetical protein
MMKSLVVFLAVAAALTATEPAKKKAKPAPAPQAVTIPKDAVPNADGNTYTYTDKSGKKWIYAKTPFGIMKSAALDPSVSNAAPADVAATKVIDKGDSYRFERPGPFGTIGWEKKKTDLNDSERQIVDSQKAPQQ